MNKEITSKKDFYVIIINIQDFSFKKCICFLLKESMSDSSSDSYAYTSDCNKYTDCFNCTMRSIDNYYFCAWNNGICTDKNMKRYFLINLKTNKIIIFL